MALDQTLGAAPDPTYDPQSIVTGLIGQQAPDLVQNGAVDPQAVLNRLIRKGLQKQSQPQGPADLSSFGKTKDELGPNAASNGETPDFASFGEPAQATAENPATGEVPVEDTGNAVSVGAESAARGLVGGVGSTMKAAARGVPAMEQAEQGAFSPLNDTLLTNPPDQENTELFKAGGAVQKFAKDIGPTPAEEKAHPIASTVGGAIGGMGIPLALGAVDPIAGIAGGAALFGISSAEDTYEAAKEHGADDQTAAQAALLSGTVNAALGSLPVAAVFKPFEKLMPQAAGLGMRILAQAAQNGITFATVGEAQEYLGQQIAKMYDPKAGYSFDTERLIGELLAGGALGALHAGLAGRGKAAETGAQPQPNAGALPGPGEAGAGAETGAGPQPQPGTGGAGAEPENSGAGAAAETQEGGAQAAPPPPFETKLKQSARDKLEEKTGYYKEFSPEIIASWSDDKLKDYVNTKFGFGSKRADDDEVLRRYGFTPEDVSAMSPEQKSAAVDEAMRNGVHAGEAPPQQGTREAPVDLKTGEDVAAAAAAASQDHSHAQGEAGNFQRGHATWDPAGDGNGLNLSIEVPPGGVRKGTVKGTGQTWETTHPHAYGEILGVPNAADGMRPDVIVGPHPDAPNAYVIDEQDKRTGKYKQSKAFVGFLSPEEARDSYLGISSKVPEQIAAIEAFPSAEFPQMVRDGLLTGPVAGKGSSSAIYNVAPGSEPGASAPASGSQAAPEPLNSAETAAPAPAHHAAIEDALRKVGVDPKHIRPVDIARAAEIHAQEGYSPEDSFQLAVARAAVEDGILTPEQVSQNYGPDIAAALESHGAPEQRVRAQTRGTPTGRPAAARENERISGGGAHGAQGGAGEAENATPAEPARTEERPRNAGRGNEREAAGAGHPESGRPAAEQRPAGGERNAERERESAHGGKAAPEREAPKASTAPLIGDRVESLPEHKVTAADGTSVKVVPVVLDAAKLITSSDEGYDKEIQPRQRERAASQAQIREIATRLDPERLGYSAEADRGAPIVGPDRMVESGNGRVQAIRAVYEHNPKNAGRYRKWLKEQGVDVAKYKDPILVRQRITDLDQEGRKDFAVAANQAATLSMSAPERALADADHISPHMLGLLADGDLNSLENRKFVRSFIGALPATERGALSTPEGGLSAEGLTRVRNAILAKAYGDPDIVSRITESTDDDVKSISNALVASAPLWAKLRSDIEEGRVPGEYDLTKDLMEAVKRTADMRGKGQKLEEYLAQQDAFDHIEPNVDGFIRNFYDPGTKRAKSGQRIADFLRFYATEAAKVSSEAGLDLGMAKVRPHEIQAAAAKKTEASGGSGVRPGVAAERNEKQRPGTSKGSRLAAAKKLGRSKFRGHKLGLPDDLFGAEPGADNKPQLVIPGAEQRSSAELAKRRAAEPLRPRVAQKPLESGLFGDEHKQIDLEEAIKAKEKAEAKGKTSAPQARESGPSDSGDLFKLAQPEDVFKAPPFYSAAARAVEGAKQEKASPNQWLGMLKNSPGVKPEEMEWLGLDQWLRDHKGSVTKQEVADYIRANAIEVREVIKAAPTVANAKAGYDLHARYPQYTLPGGENYRELLLTLPVEPGEIGRVRDRFQELNDRIDAIERGGGTAPQPLYDEMLQLQERLAGHPNPWLQHPAPGYHSSHWDEPNPLAHIRFDDRVTDGKKTLHIAEVQSDWHQAGRRQGYKQPIPEAEKPAAIEHLHELETQLNAMYSRRDTTEYAALETEAGILRERLAGMNGVPDAPFKTTWPELALKRMIRYAAENGYDRISWDTGATNAERYDLSKQIERVRYYPGSAALEAFDHSGRVVLDQSGVRPEQLPDYIGKEVAERLLNKPAEKNAAGPHHSLSGLDLKVGGEGMRGFYDKILPAAATKLVKKFGAKVGASSIAKPGGIGQWRYEGPTLTADQVRAAARRADNVSFEHQLSMVAKVMEDRNEPIGDAMALHGSYGAAELLGGKLVPITHAVPVHSVDITPALRDAAVQHGFALFQPEECFPYDAVITTSVGPLGIGAIVETRAPIMVAVLDGDAIKWRPIHNYWRHARADKRFIVLRIGQFELRCTVNHRLYVEGRGYVRADEVQVGESLRVLRQYLRPVAPTVGQATIPLLAPMRESGSTQTGDEELRGLRDGIFVQEFGRKEQCKAPVLQQPLRIEMADGAARPCGEVGHGYAQGDARKMGVGRGVPRADVGSVLKADAFSQSDAASGSPREGERVAIRSHLSGPGREWPANEAAIAAACTDGLADGVRDCDRPGARSVSESAALLQGGLGRSGAETGNRDRRQLAPIKEVEVLGSTQDLSAELARVDGVEILERGSDREPRSDRDENQWVYDLGIAGQHNYFADGVLVHNSFGHGPYEPGLKARGLDAADARKRQWAEGSPIKSADDLFAKAPANQSALVAAGREIARSVGAGVRFVDPGIKGRARTEQKIAKGRAPGRINDVVRAGFSVTRPAQADAIVAELAKRFEIADEGWAVTPLAYFDRKVMLRFPDGQVGEVQLWHPDMLRAKEKQSHRLYVLSSKLPADDPRRAAIDQRMKRIHEAALAAADPEWKALLGSAGREGNLASNASLESTRPDMPTSALSPRAQTPSESTQASPGENTNGSPSKTPYVSEADKSASDSDIGPEGGEGNGLAEGHGPIPLANTYWGGFRPRYDAPLGRQAQEYVLANGRETGREHLVGIDRGGAVAADIVGTDRNVSLPSPVVARLVDPNEAIVLHHNHPRDSTLSSQDISELGLPGIHAIWAHGHGGRASRAALTVLGRSLIAGGDPQSNVNAIARMMRAVTYDRMHDPLREALNRGLIENRRANDLLAHLANEVLRRAGLIDYHTNDNFEGEIGKLGLEPLIDQTTLDLVRSLPNGYQAVPGESYGTRRVFRHVGDLGTSFSGVEKTPRRGPQQTGVDRQRGSRNRREEAASAQLSLFGSPLHELHEVSDHFGTQAPQRMNPLPPTAPRPISAAVSNAAIAKKFKNFWASTFQPELFSDRALEADPLFARYKSRQAQEKDAVVAQSENEWEYWNKRPDAERVRFLDDMESGRAPADPTQRNMARRYRAMLDKNWELEKQYGSQAAFVEDYLPHIWEKPSEFEAFAQTRSAQVGPTWFQKKRTFDYIKEGLAAGLKLKYTNPVDIVVHRLLSGVDMRQRMDLLHKLKELGLAWEGKQGGEQLVKRGWRAINAPDRKQWVLAPDVQLLWKNGVEAKGLWQAEGAGGGLFRGWMAIKNAWVPVKLALSAFHPLHVLHIDQANTLALAWDDLTKGRNLDVALKHAGEGIATLPTLGMIHYRRGAEARAAWQKRPSQQTPEEKAIAESMQEGGFVPQLSEQLKIAAKRQLAEAWQKIQRREAGVSDWRRFVSALMRRPMEKLQAPIFEKWIPALKAAAYLAQDAEMMRRHPEYLDDPVRRQIARRAIAKSIDNRYGEMNYGTLFWNRSLKDGAIGSFLSLGWNLGFVREFGGAAMETASRPAGLLEPFAPSEGRKVAREATNKIAFALAYVGTAALINGIMSYLFTGEEPHGLDFIFARIGGQNPDGSPRRVTNMFYLREVPMLLKHIQEHGGNVLSGMKEMLWNKLMFEPFVELANNKNYFSYNIWDENAPLYKQIWQAFKHFYGDQFSPMSVSGAKHAANLSGKPFPSATEAIQHPERGAEALGAKGVGLSLLGFGPAPAYVEKSALQNRISYLYQQHVAPVSKPEEQGENTEEKMAVRQAIMIARRDHDSKGLQEAYARGKELGLSQTSMNRTGREATDIYLFSRLPNEDQKAILLQAAPEERNRYWTKAHAAVKQQLSRQVHLPGPAQLQ